MKKEYIDAVEKEFVRRLKTRALKFLLKMPIDITVTEFLGVWKKQHPYLSPYRHRIRRWIKRTFYKYVISTPRRNEI